MATYDFFYVKQGRAMLSFARDCMHDRAAQEVAASMHGRAGERVEVWRGSDLIYKKARGLQPHQAV